jgi:hypothetical protein
MEVHIADLVSTVRAVDGETLLAPQTLHKIVQVVLEAVNEQEAHRKRVLAEQRITGGVSHELEDEER